MKCKKRFWILSAEISATLLVFIAITLPASSTTTVATAPFNEQHWIWEQSASTEAIALADINKDGDLDIFVGNRTQDRIYRNDNGQFDNNVDWLAQIETSKNTHTAAWGDYDGDGDLDLAIGTTAGEPLQLFRTDGGNLPVEAIWSSNTMSYTTAVAWGDYDGDGDLDLAAAHYFGANHIYRNDSGILTADPQWISSASNNSTGILWHDFDQDGDLDLAVSNDGQANHIYFNSNGSIEKVPTWSSVETDRSYSLTLADIDRDGYTDLAFATFGGSNRVYLNQRGTLARTPAWSSAEPDLSNSVAAGDFDGDGFTDLFFGNGYGGNSEQNPIPQPNRLYTSQQGILPSYASWTSTAINASHFVAAGDIDNDGALDVIVGNYHQRNAIYHNNNVMIKRDPVWSSTATQDTHDVAWGDIDNDGDVDLAVANVGNQANRVYENVDGVLSNVPLWESSETDNSRALAWGDVDGDNDLDLVVGNMDAPVRLYLNESGTLVSAWTSSAAYSTTSVAWADVDGDGRLDLVIGTFDQPNYIFQNNGTILESTPIWQSDEAEKTYSVAWGDVDNDGDLDLAVGNYGQKSRLYRNHAGTVESSASWDTDLPDNTQSIVWADINGDGELDLLTGNDQQPNRLYLNASGKLSQSADWRSFEADNTTKLIAVDIDRDGDTDIIASNYTQPMRVYRNQLGELPTNGTWGSAISEASFAVAVGDIDQDGDLDLAVGNQNQWIRLYENSRDARNSVNVVPYVAVFRPNSLPAANLFSSATGWTGSNLDIPFVATHLQGRTVRAVRAYYSLNGGGDWQRAVQADTTSHEMELTVDQNAISTFTTAHTFTWDIAATGFSGRSDNVLFRLVAVPSFEPTPHQALHRHQYAGSADITLPLRLERFQVRVLADDVPQSDALLYHQSQSSAIATPLTDSTGTAYITDLQGFLQGRSTIEIGDQLIALLPISATKQYELYYTSAEPTEMGVDMHTVSSMDVQTLTVGSMNPLAVFSLTVSLEWDASGDAGYLQQLERDIQETSRLLFDFTNGQAVLGDVQIFFNKEQWLSVDVTIFANNAMRPNVDLGGSVITPTVAVLSDGSEIVNGYLPGQVRMSSVWNRFGNLANSTEVDWSRALAHELSHYFFFVPDNYLGIDDGGRLIPTNCAGSVMTDAFRDDYSEFLTAPDWTGDCLRTLAQLTTGKPDWEMLRSHYPFFNPPQKNPGPHTLPLAITTITFNQPENAVSTLGNPYLNIVEDTGAPLPLPATRVQAYQFAHNNTPLDLTDDRILPLGVPMGGSLLTRGATMGDRVCVIDNSHAPRRIGCNDDVSPSNSNVVMHELPNWSPVVAIAPVIDPASTFTETDPLPFVTITVTQPAITGSLYVQVFPMSPFTDTGAVTAPFVQMVSIGNNVYTATVELDDFAFEGYVRVWVADTRQVEIVSYFFGGGWGPNRYSWGANRYGWGPNRYSWGPNRYSWGIGRHGWNAPVSSGNGQVTIFAIDHIFGDTPDYTLQSVPFPSDLPIWLTSIGEAYGVTVSEALTSTTNILFSYLQRSVPNAAYEHEVGIRVYFRPINAPTWTPLETSLDTDLNQASALFEQSGIYVLAMRAFSGALDTGWNNPAYLVQTTHPVTKALASLDDNFTSVYKQNGDEWLLYDRTVDEAFRPIVNTLTSMRSGAYWIYATQPISWYLPVDVNRRTQIDAPVPATFYGEITASGSQIAVGDPVRATINGMLCGTGEVMLLEQQLAYTVQVLRRGELDCGLANASITFTVNTLSVAEVGSWNDNQAQRLDLTISTLPTQLDVTLVSVGKDLTPLLLIFLFGGLLFVSVSLLSGSQRSPVA